MNAIQLLRKFRPCFWHFVGKVEISFLRGVGWVPSKKCSFWCNGPSIKAPQIPLGHQKKNHLGAIFIEFGDTKKCHTFGGLELVPKRELAVSAACTKVKNAFKSFVENYKECAICAILREKTSFWGIHRG